MGTWGQVAVIPVLACNQKESPRRVENISTVITLGRSTTHTWLPGYFWIGNIKDFFLLWRPTFNVVQYVILLWRDFIYVKFPQWDANKSASPLIRLRAKGGEVPTSVYNLPHSCEHQIQFFTWLWSLLLHFNNTVHRMGAGGQVAVLPVLACIVFRQQSEGESPRRVEHISTVIAFRDIPTHTWLPGYFWIGNIKDFFILWCLHLMLYSS